MINFNPELKYNKPPRDREFFYNILNTFNPNIVDRMLSNAIKARQHKSNIPNEIKVIPELRSIFENEFSLIGKRGRTIKQLRI